MLLMDLNWKWQMKRTDAAEWLEALVPGSVYNDLLRNGRMDDPFYRDNEHAALELVGYDYEYRRVFYADEGLLGHDRLLLRCEGLDTLAEIFVNGKGLAKTDNMHRSYEFDLKGLLKEGENSLHVIFRSPVRYIAEKQEERPLWGGELPGVPHIRKAHYMFGWDWGPKLPDMGIWKAVAIHGFDSASIDDVYITQLHEAGSVELDVRVRVDDWSGMQSEISLRIREPGGGELETRAVVSGPEEHVRIRIDKPRLWWPRGYGEQPLYGLEAVLSQGGRELDSRKFRLGLRQMTVAQKEDQWGRSFAIEVNGTEIFAMGANYVPEDNILARCGRERTRRLLEDCAAANFNFIRVWGGGYYPDDYFYDLCDEYGLVVWQDLMFACAAYELTEDFRENIRHEIRQNLQRLRHHASLGLWCGNNELEFAWESWSFPNKTPRLKADYIKQFEVLLPELVKEADPNTFYWPSSPSSGGSFDRPNDQDYGDMHYWDVWHGRKPFTDYRNYFPRFMSEFGLQSFPCLKTVETFTLPEDRNIFSYVMENHQKNASCNEKIVGYISQYFKFPRDFDALLYLSQLVQAEGIRYGVEHWRRNRGRCMGAAYWQLNDCWPVASWSGIDSCGRWKALHYAAKRFYAPVLASACEEGTSVSLHISNETPGAVSARLSWRLLDAGSRVVLHSERQVEIGAFSSRELEKLDFAETLDSEDKKRRHYLEYELADGGGVISSGTVLFVRPKHFGFVEPGLRTELRETEEAFILSIASSAFAKFVRLDFNAGEITFSDNFFDLSAGNAKEVEIAKSESTRGLSLNELKSGITATSLIDSY